MNSPFGPCYVGEPSNSVEARYSAFNYCWKLLDKSIKDAVRVINNRAFADVAKFCVSALDRRHDDSMFEMLPNPREIWTALLLCGVNVSDHWSIFNELATKMKSDDPDLNIVLLSPRHGSSLAIAIKSMVKMFLSDECNGGEDLVSAVGSNLTMPTLLAWSKGNPPKRLVCLIEDVELFPEKTIQELIATISRYVEAGLNIVLVLGLATGQEALQRVLPRSVISVLRAETFSLQQPLCVLDVLIETVFMSPICPMMGSKTLDFLVDGYLFRNFSVASFVDGLKYAVLDHFFTVPVSHLCEYATRIACKDGDSVEFPELAVSDMDIITQLPSYNEVLKKKKSELATKNTVLEFLEARHIWSSGVQCLVKTIPHVSVSIDIERDSSVNAETVSPFLKSNRTRLSPRHLYFEALRPTDANTTIRQGIYDFMQTAKISEIFEMFKQWSDVLRKAESSVYEVKGLDRVVRRPSRGKKTANQRQNHRISPHIQDFIALLGKLEILKDELEVNEMKKRKERRKEWEKQHGSESEFDSDQDSICIEEGHSFNTLQPEGNKQQWSPQKRRRYALGNKSGFSTKVEPESVTEMRAECRSFLDMFFEVFLANPRSMPLFEILCYDRVNALKRAFSPSCRSAVQNALLSPSTYLGNDVGMDISGHPDLVICYTIFEKSGKIINLYDWFSAFCEILSKKEKDKLVLQARFTQCTMELQLLGFVKDTRRKTDHASRLVFGKL